MTPPHWASTSSRMLPLNQRKPVSTIINHTDNNNNNNSSNNITIGQTQDNNGFFFWYGGLQMATIKCTIFTVAFREKKKLPRSGSGSRA